MYQYSKHQNKVGEWTEAETIAGEVTPSSRNSTKHSNDKTSADFDKSLQTNMLISSQSCLITKQTESFMTKTQRTPVLNLQRPQHSNEHIHRRRAGFELCHIAHIKRARANARNRHAASGHCDSQMRTARTAKRLVSLTYPLQTHIDNKWHLQLVGSLDFTVQFEATVL